MNDNTDNVGIKGIWKVLKFLGVFLIIISLAAGIIIMSQFGTAQVTYTTSQFNFIGMASGLAVIFQGSVTGILLIAFSALGESVTNIENKLIE